MIFWLLFTEIAFFSSLSDQWACETTYFEAFALK